MKRGCLADNEQLKWSVKHRSNKACSDKF